MIIKTQLIIYLMLILSLVFVAANEIAENKSSDNIDNLINNTNNYIQSFYKVYESTQQNYTNEGYDLLKNLKSTRPSLLIKRSIGTLIVELLMSLFELMKYFFESVKHITNFISGDNISNFNTTR